GVALDAAGRIGIVWRDNRVGVAEYEIRAAFYSADGYTKVLDDYLLADGPSTTDFYTQPRIEFEPSTGKFLSAWYAPGPLTTTGRARWQRFTYVP
ncbi:MAG: hypothetical protein ABI743_10820, partial [bacterium]